MNKPQIYGYFRKWGTSQLIGWCCEMKENRNRVGGILGMGESPMEAYSDYVNRLIRYEEIATNSDLEYKEYFL